MSTTSKTHQAFDHQIHILPFSFEEDLNPKIRKANIDNYEETLRLLEGEKSYFTPKPYWLLIHENLELSKSKNNITFSNI